MSSYNQSIKYYNESFKTDDRKFYQELMNLIGIQKKCKKHAFILQKEGETSIEEFKRQFKQKKQIL